MIPLNEIAIAALPTHSAWYIKRFGTCKPEWFAFPFGKPLATDPTRPITTFKTARTKARKEAGVKGRWRDNRHTLVTELAESGFGEEAIMSVAGHVSRAMLAGYSHVRSAERWMKLPNANAPRTRSARGKSSGGDKLR